jgi:hypothetical protein
LEKWELASKLLRCEEVLIRCIELTPIKGNAAEICRCGSLAPEIARGSRMFVSDSCVIKSAIEVTPQESRARATQCERGGQPLVWLTLKVFRRQVLVRICRLESPQCRFKLRSCDVIAGESKMIGEFQGLITRFDPDPSRYSIAVCTRTLSKQSDTHNAGKMSVGGRAGKLDCAKKIILSL